MKNEAYIVNLTQFTQSISLLKNTTDKSLDLTVKMVANAMVNSLIDNSPVISGHLRGEWFRPPKKVRFATYEFWNSAEYIWFVELGPHGQPSLGFVQRTINQFDSEADRIIRETFLKVMADLNRRR